MCYFKRKKSVPFPDGRTTPNGRSTPNGRTTPRTPSSGGRMTPNSRNGRMTPTNGGGRITPKKNSRTVTTPKNGRGTPTGRKTPRATVAQMLDLPNPNDIPPTRRHTQPNPVNPQPHQRRFVPISFFF